MAFNYSSQTYTIPVDNQLPLYGKAQQASPTSMTTTPTNVSPTSPRTPNYLNYQFPSQIRQLRPPKTPLYVPAVLRPTEFPSKPLTPPKSLHGSLDNLENAEIEAELMRRTTEEASTPKGLAAVQSWLGDEDLGKVTALPKRDHWKPDSASPTCDSPICKSSFNLFVRKHHCRHCGHIFCGAHTPYTIPLDQEASFHPDGTMSRACEHCHNAWRRWDIARSLSRKNSQNSQQPSDGVPSTPAAGRNVDGAGSRKTEEAAQSVPKDWSWSTF